MASNCNRFIISRSLASLKSALRSSPLSSSSAAAPLRRSLNPSPLRRLSFSRLPAELGCVQSLLPLHSAVATAKMTSCLSTGLGSCRALSQGTLCRTYPGL
ncbi:NONRESPONDING TO OXYLIPINS 2, mitochondrial-like protein [Drosera capensis]